MAFVLKGRGVCMLVFGAFFWMTNTAIMVAIIPALANIY